MGDSIIDEDNKPIIVDIADKSSVGLKAIDEIFFLNADKVKLIAIEVVEAKLSEEESKNEVAHAGAIGTRQASDKNCILLSRDGTLVAESINEASTAYLMSLEEVVQRGFTL